MGDLLKNGTWEFVDLNFAELTDSVVGQGNIGTLIKSEADAGSSGAADDKENTMCGMLTVLNLRQFAHLSWPKAIGDALLEKARKHADDEAQRKLKGLLDASKKKGSEVGLMLSERFVNLPPQLVPTLHKALSEDIAWSCTTPECPLDERPFYEFENFIGVVRCFHAPPTSEASAGSEGIGGLTFPRPEDEAYLKKASFFFSFPVVHDSSKEGGVAKVPKAQKRGQERRAVFGISRKAFEQVVKQLSSMPAFREDQDAA